MQKVKVQLKAFSIAIILSWAAFACDSQKPKENKVGGDEKLSFYILALDENWIEDAGATDVPFGDTLKLSKYISNNLSVNAPTNDETILRGHFLENYLYQKYRLKNAQGFSPKISLNKKEIEILREKKLLGYILPHKGVLDYQEYLLTKLNTNPLIFIGESVISLLKYRLKGIKELEGLEDFLEKSDRLPFVVVIDKDLYLSLREEVLTKTDISNN